MKRKWLMMRLLLMDGYQRGRYLKKHGYFNRQGENCYFQPVNFGTEPHLLEFGDNVVVASGVKFVSHDICSYVFNNLYQESIPNRVGKICMGSNVFIGSNAIILYDVTIGNNVIIAAGALVNKDVPDNSVVAGTPAKKIGSFDGYYQKYKNLVNDYTWEAADAKKREKQIRYFWSNDVKRG